MRQSHKLPCIFSLFLLAASLQAWAGSVNSFSDDALPKGAGTKLAWSFTSENMTEQFPEFSRSFGGTSIFDSGKVTDGRMSGYSVAEESFSGTSFLDESDRHFFRGNHGHRGCEWRRDCQSVPEGGTPLSYLILSGLAILAGILISGKQHRATRTA
jgi:hypothetical protein